MNFYLILFEKRFFLLKSLEVKKKHFTFAKHLKDNVSLLQ